MAKRAKARGHQDNGARFYNNKQFAAAEAEFRKAEAAVHDPNNQKNIAECLIQQKRYDEAIAAYRQYIADPAVSRDMVKAAEAKIAKVEGFAAKEKKAEADRAAAEQRAEAKRAADEQKRAEQAQKKADALAKAEAQKKAQEEKKAAAKAAAATAAPTPASAPATASAEWKQALKDFKKAKKKFEDGLPRIERRYADAVKADNYDDMRKAMDAYANHIGEYQTALSHLEIASDDPNKSKEIIEARALYKTHDNKWWEVNRQLVFSREPQSMEEIVKRPGAKGAEVIQLSQGFAGQKMKVEYQLHEDDTKALEFLNKQGGYKFVREESVPKGRKYRLIYVVRNEEFTSVYSRISRAGNDRQAAADAASRFMNLTVKV